MKVIDVLLIAIPVTVVLAVAQPAAEASSLTLGDSLGNTRESSYQSSDSARTFFDWADRTGQRSVWFADGRSISSDLKSGDRTDSFREGMDLSPLVRVWLDTRRKSAGIYRLDRSLDRESLDELSKVLTSLQADRKDVEAQGKESEVKEDEGKESASAGGGKNTEVSSSRLDTEVYADTTRLREGRLPITVVQSAGKDGKRVVVATYDAYRDVVRYYGGSGNIPADLEFEFKEQRVVWRVSGHATRTSGTSGDSASSGPNSTVPVPDSDSIQTLLGGFGLLAAGSIRRGRR